MVRAQAKVEELSYYISEAIAQKPAVADFLPDDPEVTGWRARYAKLCARREEAIQKREAAQAAMPSLGEAAKYEGNFGVIANLERAQNNLLRRLRGEPLGGGWEGGISRI